MLQSVIFDLDNTLYDYDKCNDIAESALVRRIASAFQISEIMARERLLNAKYTIKKRLGDDVAASHNRMLYMQNICEQQGESPLKYAMDFYECYWNTLIESMELFPYVMPVFRMLKERNIRIAILTDLTAHIQYRKICQLGITDDVACLVTSEEAGAEKPSGKMFDLILFKLQLQAQDVLMIGDSVQKDIRGASMAGMRALLFDRKKDMMREIGVYLGDDGV